MSSADASPSKNPAMPMGTGSDSGALSSSDASALNTDGSTGVLPPTTDPGAMGPFAFAETYNVGPGNNYSVIAPMMLGQNGIKNPILVWSPGAMANPALYQTLLNTIASHGIVVVSYNETAQGPDMTAGIDWIIPQSTTQGSPYYNR
jgi:hypothetical protein